MCTLIMCRRLSSWIIRDKKVCISSLSKHKKHSEEVRDDFCLQGKIIKHAQFWFSKMPNLKMQIFILWSFQCFNVFYGDKNLHLYA